MSGRFTKEEREKIIDALIDDAHTKNALKQERTGTRKAMKASRNNAKSG
jgi:hypothetical protein